MRPALLFAGLVFLAACRDAKKPPVVAPTQVDSADQVIYGMRTLVTDRGLLRADVRGDTAYVHDEGTRFVIRNVTTVFYAQNGARNATLTSRTGTYDTRRNQMESRGNVVVVSEDGRRLTTEQLRFDQVRNEISSDSSFVLTEPGRSLTGIGFVADPNLTNIRVLRGAAGNAGQITLPGPTTPAVPSRPPAPPPRNE
ncbi:MAG TPA: LPS export ABC transporter periplasmic protein LptC [Gemmatimonadaceae bacterium]|nr:LPS export ABC transporter periplasmic protein LptC [Gemmatimonadaceae bacterium]